MDSKYNLFLSKNIDWSVLNYGINIPVELQSLIYESIGGQLGKGDNLLINLIVDNDRFEVKLTNINFDENKYPNHKDLLQIRYSANSKFAIKLREYFNVSYNYLAKEKLKLKNSRQQIKVPDQYKEQIAIYTTNERDTLSIECITQSERLSAIKEIYNIPEEAFENDINYIKRDPMATIEHRSKIMKIRRLDISICDMLKKLYEHRCQICGIVCGEEYTCKVAEAHHIEPFTQSLNNDSDNILILCPNHHRIIHNQNPIFDKEKNIYRYPNGFEEGLALNYHLINT